MSDKIVIRWEVYDGYVGGSGPQSFYFNQGNIFPEMTDEDLEQELESSVFDAFLSKISYDIRNRDEAMAMMKKYRDELRAKDGFPPQEQ